jgi:tRNA(Ile)-lysidine synthase
LTRLQQQVRRTILKHNLCPPGTRVLIALSGGSDSVALTLLLRDLSDNGGFTLAGAAHLNHGLRPTAGRDEQFCRELADQLGLPIWVESADIQGYAATQRLSVEDAARRVRYGFLDRVASEAGATRIAVGHTRNDQAETFLLKLIRGAGLTGLGGIYPRRGNVIRPLLDVSREDLRTYLHGRGQPWADDETNADVANPRNRVRHLVLPELDRAYGGPTTPAIARAAGLIREDAEWLDEVSRARYEAVGARTATGLELEAGALAAEPLPIRRRVLLAALRSMAAGREVGMDHVEAALDVLGGVCAAAEAPGTRVELRRGKLVLVDQGSGPK